MKGDGYTSRKAQLLKSFDRAMSRSRRVLVDRYGDERTRSLIGECRREYEALIPQIPYIGQHSPFLIFLIPTCRYLAVYRVLQQHGLATEEAGPVIYRMNEAEWKVIPRLLCHLISYLWFSPLFIRRIRKRADESQAHAYPDNYVLTFVCGDGRTFDYGFDYTECAGCKFLRQQGAPELAPIMCSLDKTASETLGWGLTRTTTIAEGYAKCDFRFKKRGRTNIALPPVLQKIKAP